MKKLVSAILCASLLVGTALGFHTVAAEKGGEIGKVPVTSDKITVDGKMDEVYKQGLKLLFTNEWANSKDKTLKNDSVAYMLWDGKENFYIFADIIDATPGVRADKNAWSIDCLEVFFDYDNKGASKVQLRVDYEGAISGTSGNEAETQKDGLIATKVVKNDKGYTVEMQVKAMQSNTAKTITAGQKIGFQSFISNFFKKDTTVLQNVNYCGAGQSGNADWGYITLSADKVAAPVAKTTTKAATTLDAGIITAAMALASASAAIVFKKKR